MKRSYNDIHSERAAIIPLAAILITTLIFLLALAVDGYRLLTADLQQHNNAEYGSEAAAKEFFMSSGTLTSAKDRAEALALQNVYFGTGNQAPVDLGTIGLYPSPGTEGMLSAGCWNTTTQSFVPSNLAGSAAAAALVCAGATKPAIKLNLNSIEGKGVTMFFARMLGLTEGGLAASAISYKDDSLGITYPIIVTLEP